MSVHIRELRPEDWKEAGRATANAYREFASGMDECRAHDFGTYIDEIEDIASRAGRTTVLGAFDGASIVGTVTLEITGRIDTAQAPPRPGEIHVRMLGIDPVARGRGAGHALMAASLELARRLGSSHITLHTTESMGVARGMYERMGFRRTGDAVTPSGEQLYGYVLMLDETAAPL